MDSITAFLEPLYTSFQFSAKWLLICFAVFIPLSHFLPGDRSQRLFRGDMKADTMYWFCGPVFYRPIAILITVTLLSWLYTPTTGMQLNTHGLAPLGDLPLWLQVILVLLATDFLQYWMHRLFHRMSLWKYHAVHHSSKNVDWLSSARFHPVNIVLYSTLVNAVVYVAGFNPEAFLVLLPFNMLYSPLVHANLNWNYGPFRYVLASPVFHRWHHTHPREGGNKNFAPTFPFIDLMFGTFYMPKGVVPSGFGAPYDDIPDDFFGQLAYPFRRRPPK